MNDNEREIRSQARAEGERDAWVKMLRECLQQLGYESSDAAKVAWISERESAIAALRDLCAEFDDNDWPDNLHLYDIITKHVAPHLED